jgi:hypothetical protein
MVKESTKDSSCTGLGPTKDVDQRAHCHGNLKAFGEALMDELMREHRTVHRCWSTP